LRDISTFNPSGIKGKEKINNSMMIIPPSSIDIKMRGRDSSMVNTHFDHFKQFEPHNKDGGYNSLRTKYLSGNYLNTDSPEKNNDLNLDAP
jgi:hypothetical protein